MKNDNNNKFDGTTEIDEAYIGGSETNKHADKKNKMMGNYLSIFNKIMMLVV